MSVQLTDEFLAKIAGWEAVKAGRAAIAAGKVLSSNWTPPLLKGVVQEGTTSYRAGLVIKGTVDIENLCPCRQSREWGTICAHSVAVGLHHIRQTAPAPPPKTTAPAAAAPAKPAKVIKRLQRAPHQDDGEALDLFVIFPPNLAQVLPKGKVMLYFEGAWSRGRMPLNAVPVNIAFGLTRTGSALLDLLEEIAGDTPGMLMASHDQLSRILKALASPEVDDKVTIGKSIQVAISPDPIRLKIEATLETSGEIHLRLLDRFAPEQLLNSSEPWLLQGAKFSPLALPGPARNLLSGPVRVDRTQIPLFLSEHWPALEKGAELRPNFDPGSFEVVAARPQIILSLAGGLATLAAQLQFKYGSTLLTHGLDQRQDYWMPDPDNPKRYLTRDPSVEQHAIARIVRAGFTGPHQAGIFQLAGQNSVLTFFATLYPKLQREWQVTLDERLERSTTQNLERIEPRFEISSSGEQWFDLDVAFNSTSGERFSAAEIQKLILSGQNHVKTRNGKFAIIDTGAVEELQEVLLDCAPTQQNQKYRIANTQAGFLASALKDHPWKVTAPESFKDRALKQSGQLQLEPPPLGNLAELLRPYQKEGVAWLEFLRQNNFGGILADEMGLGKTLQTLAFLRSVLERTPKSERKPSLVVCPTSLVFNWVAEVRKFTPELRVLPLHGPKRHALFAELPNCDLAVTSYALVRRDSEHYGGFEFDTVVLDEAQHIKNRQTQNAQAVKIIRADHRLVLTGTPIENSVLDLWSIFDFLMPGYLGSAQDFKERYELPIVRERNPEAQSRLARRIRPFLLRRLKQEVAKDLPEKIEQVAYCELTDEQQALYQQLLEASRQEITTAVDANGLQKSRMIILNALLRLRQVCCDLRLLKLDQGALEKTSGKLDLFNELLQEVIDGGHRVLVFSQFVQMLSLLKESLQKESIEFCYLDGSTTDRQEVVTKFQNSSIPVFLISLKAGGVGLNLTGADTVIHFDPWWNPAVEAQATDRAHRIGQTRVVTSYKLITRGTVEEKILNLQNRKREIIQGTLGGEEELAAALTWDDLRELFS